MRPCCSGWVCMPLDQAVLAPAQTAATSAVQGEFVAGLAAGLARRDSDALLRRLQPAAGLDLASNDYLGFASDPRLVAAMQEALATYGAGAGASRLLRGHQAVHADAEAFFATAAGRQAGLLFSSGWAANVGLLTALVGPHDRVLSDALNHASLIDGMRLSRAQRAVFAHGDLRALQRLLTEPWPQGRTFVVVESVYSMDGDLADLTAIADLCCQHGALLLVDEAHATGLYGHHEQYGATGLVEALGLQGKVLASVHTGGKALGTAGAVVVGDQPLIDHLVNHARSFVFSTAVPPVLAAGLRAGLALAQAQRPLVTALHQRAARFRDQLQQAGLQTGPSVSCIVPVLLGSNERALWVAQRLQAQGLDVRAVRPPTVPVGTARLRLCVRMPLLSEELDAVAAAIIAAVCAWADAVGPAGAASG
jgi:8-amino-7-oxononanoate synthase